jgi:hypothetical protein
MILNTEIKKIVNVFQHNYKNVNTYIGFGDYLRGCLFLINFCKKHNVSYDLNIDDFIFSKYLKNIYNKFHINEDIRKNICYFERQNTDRFSYLHEYYCQNGFLDSFIDFCNNTPIYDNVCYILTNARSTENIFNETKEEMKNFMEPTELITNQLNVLLLNLNLIYKKYITIHIRFGDNSEFNSNYNNVLSKLNNTIIKDSQKYVIICDSNNLNKTLINYFKYNQNVKFIDNKKIHSANRDLNEDDAKDILIDFYIMSMSDKIICFSIYEHGSSFSKTCSEIYDIKYECVML